MGGIFSSSTDIQITTRLPLSTTISDALAVLQNPEEFLQLAVHLSEFKRDTSAPAGETWFIMSEKLFFGTNTYKTKWTEVQNGVDCEVYASLGTRLTSRYRIEEDAEGVIFIEEDHVTVSVCEISIYDKQS